MVQLLLAVEYIHSQGVVHRDIKPSNVLVYNVNNQAAEARLCDFGLAKPYCPREPQTPSTVTSWYRPPEVALGRDDYSFPVDIWSLGCTFFEMWAQQPWLPRVGDDNDIILSAILGAMPVELPPRRFRELIRDNKSRQTRLTPLARPSKRTGLDKRIPGADPLLLDLLSHMLEFDWNQRWTATQCLSHPYFLQYQKHITEVRSQYPPVPPPESVITIINCREREWAAEVAHATFNNRKRLYWYSHRALFQAIDLFDRYLQAMYHSGMAKGVESQYQGRLHDRFGTQLRFLTCLYLSVKLFSTIHSPVSFTSIVPPEFRSEAAVLQAQQFEGGLVKNCLQYRIYRPTVYESRWHIAPAVAPGVIHPGCPTNNRPYDDSEVRVLLKRYLSQSQWTGTVLALNQQWR
jgi:serine/threonine protein kinase